MGNRSEYKKRKKQRNNHTNTHTHKDFLSSSLFSHSYSSFRLFLSLLSSPFPPPQLHLSLHFPVFDRIVAGSNHHQQLLKHLRRHPIALTSITTNKTLPTYFISTGTASGPSRHSSLFAAFHPQDIAQHCQTFDLIFFFFNFIAAVRSSPCKLNTRLSHDPFEVNTRQRRQHA